MSELQKSRKASKILDKGYNIFEAHESNQHEQSNPVHPLEREAYQYDFADCRQDLECLLQELTISPTNQRINSMPYCT
jgi:hypothetical protein